MRHQIIKVNDIYAAIQDAGIMPYLDTLVQDARGDYHYIENVVADCVNNGELVNGWRYIEHREPGADPVLVKYRIVRLPLAIAYFIIDAMKLQTQVLYIGSGEYGGPHGGKVSWFVKNGDSIEPVPGDAIMVEKI